MQVRSSNYEDTRNAKQETVTRPILVNSLMSAIPANVYRSMLSFPWSKPLYASSEMPYRLLYYIKKLIRRNVCSNVSAVIVI